MKYDILVVDGSDATTALEAINLTDAIDKAEAWLAKGDWGDEEDYLTLRITDDTGEESDVEVVVGGLPVPACLAGERHDWESPHEVVGGLRENPGVWALEGTQLSFTEVCCHCGQYRHTKTESTDGSFPRTPQRIKYGEPDEASLAWAGLMKSDDGE